MGSRLCSLGTERQQDWGLGRNAELQVPPQTCWIRIYIFNKIPRRFVCTLKLRSSAVGPSLSMEHHYISQWYLCTQTRLADGPGEHFRLLEIYHSLPLFFPPSSYLLSSLSLSPPPTLSPPPARILSFYFSMEILKQLRLVFVFPHHLELIPFILDSANSFQS